MDFATSPKSLYHGREQLEAYREFFTEELFRHRRDAQWCDVSLTLKQGIVDGGCFEALNSAKVSRCIAQLMQSLNRRVYKNAYRRNNKRLACIPVIEKGKTERLHVHMLLEIPYYMHTEPDKFFNIVKNEWANVRWSHAEMRISLLAEKEDVERWTKYILKDLVTNDETISIENIYLGRTLH